MIAMRTATVVVLLSSVVAAAGAAQPRAVEETWSGHLGSLAETAIYYTVPNTQFAKQARFVVSVPSGYVGLGIVLRLRCWSERTREWEQRAGSVAGFAQSTTLELGIAPGSACVLSLFNNGDATRFTLVETGDGSLTAIDPSEWRQR